MSKLGLAEHAKPSHLPTSKFQPQETLTSLTISLVGTTHHQQANRVLHENIATEGSTRPYTRTPLRISTCSLSRAANASIYLDDLPSHVTCQRTRQPSNRIRNLLRSAFTFGVQIVL